MSGAAASSGLPIRVSSDPPTGPPTGPSSGPTSGPTIKTFKQVVSRLKSFNEAHGKMGDLNGIIGGLNDKVKKLGELKGRLNAVLTEISTQVQSLTVGNLETSRKKLSEMTSTMHSELTALNNMLPFPEGTTGATRGGFQYKKLKSKTRRSKTRRSKTRRSKSKHSKTKRSYRSK